MNNKPAEVAYGCTSGAADEGGLINDKLIEGVEGYAADHGVPLDLDEVKDGLKDNPLLTSQMETLNATFELVWRLGTLNFTDGSLTRSSERKGGQRFQKAIRFSSNLDLIGILEETDPDGFARVLLNWLVGDRVSCAEGIESRLTRMLAVFSEPALFKTCKGDSGTVFTISGIYGCLLEGDDDASVDLVEGKEAQGPTRILKTAVEAGLYPALDIAGHTVTAAKDVSKAELEAYASRIRVSSQLANVKLDNPERNTMENRATAEPLDEPRNLIYFGAPGTGKSHELGEHADRYFDDDHRCRVTFYPDYTYSQFVGCFKPMTEQVVDSDGNKRTAITYRYALGPFLETYVKAVKNPEQNYLLIVEEINRANPAAVFGDVFQLLDRRSDGCSEYTVAAPEDMREQLMVEFDNDAIAASKLAIPSNMYIWATMNSADQGVFPMDTAFKRRWDFRYMGINEGEDADIDGTPLNKIEVPCGGRTVVWNNLRHAINDFMASDDLKINEDKLLGPFFINPNALTPERFADVFKDKVLLYLYEDAGKTKRKKMFKGELNTYAKVCEAFDESGEGIFGNGFDDHIVYDDDADDVAPEE